MDVDVDEPRQHGLASSLHGFRLQRSRIWSGALVDFFDLAVAYENSSRFDHSPVADEDTTTPDQHRALTHRDPIERARASLLRLCSCVVDTKRSERKERRGN